MEIRSTDPAIQPSEHCQLWWKLQEVAFEATKVAELEKSGVRDGDGYWHGSDVIGHLIFDLLDAVSRLQAVYQLPADLPDVSKQPAIAASDDDISW